MDLNDYKNVDFIKLVIFQINQQQFALPLDVVDKAIQIVEIQELPNAPKYICGVINVHGEIVPVINMRRLFGMQEKELEVSDKLLIVSSSKIKIALWIDEVQNVIEINKKDLISSDKIKYGQKNVKGVVKLESGMLVLSDIEEFLSPNELDELELALQETALLTVE